MSVRVDKEVAQMFKDKCRENGHNVGGVVQAFMEKYNEGKIALRFSKTGKGFGYELYDLIKD
jgi:hypothetical protein